MTSLRSSPLTLQWSPTTSGSVWRTTLERRGLPTWTDSKWRLGIDQPDGSVPGTFLVADIEGAIVGRASIRHELNEFLAREGVHIGYCVLAEHRRRGYATEILRQSLVVARAVGVQRVLTCCDDDTVGRGRLSSGAEVFSIRLSTTVPETPRRGRTRSR